MEPVTDEDIRMIEYFWNVKGDLTRWSSWEKRRPIIAAAFPELIDAFEKFQSAEKTLQAVVDRICDKP